MNNKITVKQLFAINKIEEYTEYRFEGSTKLEATKFISNYYDLAKSEMLKYDCMCDKYGE